MAQIKIQSLGYCVYSALADLGLPTSRFFTQFLHWAVKGYRELNIIGLMPSIKYVQLPVNPATNTVLLPLDYINFIKIGVNCHNICINLDYNEELVMHSPDYALPCPCTGTQISNYVAAVCQCEEPFSGGFPYWNWGGAYNGLWNYDLPNLGVGPGFYGGGYRINRELGVIQIDSCLAPKIIYMEYQSTGIDMNSGDAIIPQDAIPALNNYIHWERCRFSTDRVMKADAQGFRRMYLKEKEDLEMRFGAMTKWEYIDIFRRYTFQAVKA
jgi:hypothetical protein